MGVDCCCFGSSLVLGSALGLLRFDLGFGISGWGFGLPGQFLGRGFEVRLKSLYDGPQVARILYKAWIGRQELRHHPGKVAMAS